MNFEGLPQLGHGKSGLDGVFLADVRARSRIPNSLLRGGQRRS